MSQSLIDIRTIYADKDQRWFRTGQAKCSGWNLLRVYKIENKARRVNNVCRCAGSNIEAADSIARFQLTPTVSSTRVLDAWVATNKTYEHQGNVRDGFVDVCSSGKRNGNRKTNTAGRPVSEVS